MVASRSMTTSRDLEVVMVEGRCTGTVLMGGLHQTIHHAVRFDVVGVDVDGGGVVAVVQEGADRFVNQVDQLFLGLGFRVGVKSAKSVA
jgi:hypothetical protein